MDHEQFVEHFKRWMTFLEIEKNVSIHTLKAYKSDSKQFISFWSRLLSEPTKVSHSDVVRRYIVSLYYKKISKRSLARKISCLRSFAWYARREGLAFSIEARVPKIEKKLPITLSVDEIFYLLDSLDIKALPTSFPYRDKALFELLYATGARCSEIIAIERSHITMSDKTIRVLGKGRKERIVLFGVKAHEALSLYFEKEWQVLAKKNDSDFLFLNKDGMQLTPRSIQRILEMFRPFLKLDRKVTPHTLRHSFATHMLNQGADIRVVQELLGHRTLATTELYTQVTSSELSEMCDLKHPLAVAS